MDTSESLAASFSSLRSAAGAACTASTAADRRAARSLGLQAVLELKGSNRELYESLEAARQGTAAAKGALETTNLQLQNLEYEKSHYSKEIKTCRDFRSSVDDEALGLLPEAAFLQLPSAAAAAGDAHALMLSRLTFELGGAPRRSSAGIGHCAARSRLAERQELGLRLQELKSRKKALLETLSGRRKLLLELASELRALQAAGKPLAQLVEHQPTAVNVHQLPPPLFSLYAALQGAVGAGGEGRRCVLSVQGVPPEPGPAEAAEPGEAAGGEAEEEDGASRRKRAREADADAVHPLSVFCELHTRGAKRAVVCFEYQPGKAAIVTRVQEGERALLNGILGEGDMEALEEGLEEGSVPAHGPPLRWAATLAEGDSEHAARVVAALLAAADK